MSIHITVEQKLFGSQTMPLEIILGDQLHYGHFAVDQLNDGELGETEFVAYHPDHIGRGFSVIWNPQERKRIDLRLPQPTTAEELRDFYTAVDRMVKHWDAKLTVDGSRVRPADFLAGYGEAVAFNEQIIRQFSGQVLDGKHDALTLYCTMWPLSVGRKEAEVFAADPATFARWLHEKQTVDACFASPDFYQDEAGIFGRYVFLDGVSCIFPKKPSVPFGVTDPSTGKLLECDRWLVLLALDREKAPLCQLNYADFMDRLPKDRVVYYDADHVQVLEMSEEEIRKLSEDQ